MLIGSRRALLRRPAIVIAGALPPTTWDPANTSSVTLSGGNLVATANPGNGGTRSARSISGSKKAYWETITTVDFGSPSGRYYMGVVNSTFVLGSPMVNVNNAAYSRTGGPPSALAGFNSVNVLVVGWAQGDNLGMAVDFGNSNIWFRTNGGNWNNDVLANQNPATNTGGISISGIGSPVWVAWTGQDNLDSVTAQFSSSSWTYAAPAGFSQI